MSSTSLARSQATAKEVPSQRSRRVFRKNDHLIGWLFVAPTVIFSLVFFAYPLVSALFYSFTTWDMQNAPIWVGLQNYVHLFYDRVNFPYFWHSLVVTLTYMVIAIPLSLVTALTLALMINSLRRGQDLFKVLFYLPVITTEVAVATIWKWLYDPLFGLINLALHALGLHGQDWINQPSTALPALSLISAWQCGNAMIIFLAGLKGIPTDYYEAARIDGASAWQRFRSITLPLLRPTTFFLLITGQIAGFQLFGLVYVLYGAGGGTIGGPQQVGLSYVLELYDQAFRYFQMGPACAMSMLLFTIIAAFTFIQFRFVPQTAD